MQIKNFLKYYSFFISIIAIFPLIKFINFGLILLFITSFLVSLKYEFKKRWLLNSIGIIAIILTALRINLENLVIPLIEANIVLLSLKFLEEKKYRDYMQIYLLTVFIASGYSLLTMKLSFLIYIFFILLLLSIAGVLLTYFDSEKNIILNKNEIFKISIQSSMIFLFSIPLATVIFIILPRIKTPLFDYFNQEKVALSGFTDKLTLGDVSKIQLDNSIIFRVSMKKIPQNKLYWRGLVLDYFDGKKWINSGKIKENFDEISVKGQFIYQTFYLEPYYSRYLFGLDKPLIISIKKAESNGLIYTKYWKEITKRIKYKVYSIISDKAYQKNFNKKFYLQIPSNISKKIVALSQKLKAKSDNETLVNIEIFFRNSNFKYSLKNLPISSHPLESFLFKQKEGNCEYFASAFALLLRLTGIPSRIVAGYKGGLYSTIGKYYMVSQKDAHVWVEAYLNNYWLRIDPVELLIPLKISPSQKKEKIVLHKNLNWKTKLKIYLDLINFYWIKFVINYNFEKQIKIALSVQKLKINYKFFLIIIILSFILFFILKNYKPYDKLLIENFYKKLKKFGYEKMENETLREFLHRIDREDVKHMSEKFINYYERIYFRDEKFSINHIKNLKKFLNELDKLKQ